MKKVMSVAGTQIVKTQRDLTNANARLVSVEMATTAQVSQHFCSVVSWLQADWHCTEDLWMRLSLSFFVWLMYKNLVLSPGLTVKSLSRNTSLKRRPIELIPAGGKDWHWDSICRVMFRYWKKISMVRHKGITMIKVLNWKADTTVRRYRQCFILCCML